VIDNSDNGDGSTYLSTTILDIVTPANRKRNLATGIANSKAFEKQEYETMLNSIDLCQILEEENSKLRST
jgi:hypothetical protein